ncbi:MAG TPA: hypothetical protein VEW04_07510 [Allosphingosinicella sp.]|nr:hypothetical protein [Allosphingosinicella sp.]
MQGPAFSYVEILNGAIVTSHALRLRVEAGAGFRATPVTSRVAQFGGHSYEVSLAALLGPGEAVMVHAERAADSSGASNYDDLPRAGWPDPRFRLRSMCDEIDAATAAQEHDLAFLARNGWNPEGALALEQYLATTADHNQEVVVSLVVRVPGCDQADAVQAALRRLREKVRVGPA